MTFSLSSYHDILIEQQQNRDYRDRRLLWRAPRS